MASDLRISREYYNALENGRRAITERMADFIRYVSRNRR